MSNADPAKRPVQATMAAGFVAGASALLVLTAYDGVANLRTVENRESVTETLKSLSASGLGLSFAEALRLMQVAMTVAAVAGVVTLILAVFVFRGDRAARIGLSVAAVPVLLTSPFTGGLLGSVVAVGTCVLWGRPTRDWFAGKSPQPRPERSTRDPEETRPNPFSSSPSSPADRVDAPAPHPVPFGTPASPSSTTGTGEQTAPWGQPSGDQSRPGSAPASYATPTTPTVVVPSQVRIACLLTWVFSGLAALLYLGVALAVLISPTTLMTEIEKNPMLQNTEVSHETLRWLLFVVSLGFLGWCLATGVLALLVWRGHGWARYVLVGSAGVAAVAAVFSFPVGIAHIAACIAVIVLLLRAPWSQRPGPPGGPPSWHSSGPPSGPHAGPPVPPRDDRRPEWPASPDGPDNPGPDSPGPDNQNNPGRPPVW